MAMEGDALAALFSAFLKSPAGVQAARGAVAAAAAAADPLDGRGAAQPTGTHATPRPAEAAASAATPSRSASPGHASAPAARTPVPSARLGATKGSPPAPSSTVVSDYQKYLRAALVSNPWKHLKGGEADRYYLRLSKEEKRQANADKSRMMRWVLLWRPGC